MSNEMLRVDRIATKNTDLVLEGAPRSANTFSELAFRFSQPRPVRLAHHLHVPAQVVYGHRNGIPTLVLIRNPVDSVISANIRNPSSDLLELLRDWISFYRTIYPFRHRIVLATFEEVTTDFGQVIFRLNKQYGTDFRLFQHTDENVRVIFQQLERMSARKYGNGTVVETMVARPSGARNKLKNNLVREIGQTRYAAAVGAAMRLYETLVSDASPRQAEAPPANTDTRVQ